MNTEKRDSRLHEILGRFAGLKIAVIGDIILDKYIYGKVERISPEAPIPVVHVEKEKYVPGGAANVAANLATLKGRSYLIGVTGKDKHREILLERCKDLKIDTVGILVDPGRQTILKTRVIGMNQQLLRIDYENTDYLVSNFSQNFSERIREIKPDAIIISDYAKGSVTKSLIDSMRQYSLNTGIRLIIDPKPKHKKWYKETGMITPNKTETESMVGFEIKSSADFLRAGSILRNELQSEIILTAGPEGIYVFNNDKMPHHIPTQAREVYDVSGAGDTVVAVLALSICAGANLVEAATIANYAAGLKVGKVGTSPVRLEELNNLIMY